MRRPGNGAAPAFCYSENSIMGIDPELLEILACPACKTPVTLVKDGAGLRCGRCAAGSSRSRTTSR